jgi:hypothetical protein
VDVEKAFSLAIYFLISFWIIDFFWPDFLGAEIFQSGEKGRTTGLFTEPSSVGVFSGFLIVSLLFNACPYSRVFKIFLGMIAVFMAVVTQSKIFVLFLLIHFFIFELWRFRIREFYIILFFLGIAEEFVGLTNFFELLFITASIWMIFHGHASICLFYFGITSVSL